MKDKEDFLVLSAEAFAMKAHINQVRKYTGEPYFFHCQNVASRVARLPICNKYMVAAAYLHDTIEDTDCTYLELERAFGARVANLVRELTDQYSKALYPEMNRKKRKELEAVRLGNISDEAKLIKWCDLMDNTSSIVKHDPGFASIYLKEKAHVLSEMKVEDILIAHYVEGKEKPGCPFEAANKEG